MSFDNIKAGFKAIASVLSNDARKYTVKGFPVVCPICKADHFTYQRILMNTSGASFMGLDWANADATAMACERCSHILWFKEIPDRVS